MSTDWTPTLWSECFEEMLDEELDSSDQWAFHFNYGLTETLTKEERRRGWRVYSHCAYGRFQCGECSKTWRSARVVLVFRYRLRDTTARGTVLMRPYGQACKRCREEFELPGFSQNEVEEALLGLFGKIKKNCYDEDDEEEEEDEEDEEEEEEDEEEEDGSEKVSTRPHEKALCEACRLGICCQE
ncbi:receptor-transporting protein 3 isoform X1 [Salmo trutta]|uniref:Receptor-transporting protein 3-like n=1 Tax=Salmo trutta TaxID=8032 RepID=A0A674DVJ9_SALTR|nr:receptor-transporting protein 3-like isoform X1 [Salmo trutta]XP_029590431.1 receptor-transporting protein 3-like isoform X1 [Salmo trutta]